MHSDINKYLKTGSIVRISSTLLAAGTLLLSGCGSAEESVVVEVNTVSVSSAESAEETAEAQDSADEVLRVSAVSETEIGNEANTDQSSATEPDTVTQSDDQSASDEQEVITDGDRTVLTGTLMTCTPEDFMNLQPEVTAENLPYLPTEPVRVIVLDELVTLNCRSSGDMGNLRSGDVYILGVDGSAEALQHADGHITFSIDEYNCWWPSDVRLPLGQPGTEDVHILS